MRIFIYECISAGGMGTRVPDSLRREGAAMLDAVVADFQRLPNVGVVTMRSDSEDFRELAARSDWTLVIAPEFDELLERLAQTVLAAGVRPLGPLPGAISLTADKLRLAKHWHRTGVSHPPTVSLETKLPVDVPLPWIIKPQHGAGSQGILIALRPSDLERWDKNHRHAFATSEFIVQHYVANGTPVSVSLLVGPSQTIPLSPCTQRLDGRSLSYQGGSLPLPSPLAERATKLALQAVAGIDGLQGYVGVDLVLGDDGVDYAIEINPRLTTSYIGLRQLCEDNLAELMLRIVQGQETKTPAWKAGAVWFNADGTTNRQTR
jgi:predicted ATP-grasp superfamily ATP-dependent carboligase